MHPIENLRYVARARGVPSGNLVREAAMSLDWLGLRGPDLVIACRRIVERQPTVGRLWWLAASLLAAGGTPSTSEVTDLVDALDRDPTSRRLAHALADDSTVVTIGCPETVADALGRRGDVRVLCADSQHEASSFLQRLDYSGVDAEALPSEYLARAIADASAVLIEAVAVDANSIVAQVGSHVLAAVAAQLERPVWLVAPLGTRLPSQYVAAIGAHGGGDDPELSSSARPWAAEIDVLPTNLATHVVTSEGIAPLATAGLCESDCAFLPELLPRATT